MYKSKSLSSGITGTSQTSLLKTTTFKFPCKKGPILFSPYPQQHSLKFPKNLIRKPTEKHMLLQTEQSSRKLCMKAHPQAHRTTILEQCSSKRSLKQAQFSYLANQSPCKPIVNRDYSDIGLTQNRRKCNPSQFQSANIISNINCENTHPEKITRAINGKYHEGHEVKKNLQWTDQKISRQYFQQKYKRCGAGRLNQKQKNTQEGYASIHLKYTTFK